MTRRAKAGSLRKFRPAAGEIRVPSQRVQRHPNGSQAAAVERFYGGPALGQPGEVRLAHLEDNMDGGAPIGGHGSRSAELALHKRPKLYQQRPGGSLAVQVPGKPDDRHCVGLSSAGRSFREFVKVPLEMSLRRQTGVDISAGNGRQSFRAFRPPLSE